jgi:hypothetical protein
VAHFSVSEVVQFSMSVDTLEGPPQGLCLRWIARPAPSKLGYPSDQLSVSLFLLNKREPPQTKQIRHRDPVTAFQAQVSLRCERITA